MATTLTYTVSPFVPFTKIVSADVNQYFTDIKSRINWAGGISTTTGLGDDNIQSNSVSGGGLTRSSKLKAGTANYAIYNDGTGKITEAVALPLLSGGTGSSLTIGNTQDVLQVTSGGVVAFAVSPPAPALRVYSFTHYT